jgi:hypothetical protein
MKERMKKFFLLINKRWEDMKDQRNQLKNKRMAYHKNQNQLKCMKSSSFSRLISLHIKKDPFRSFFNLKCFETLSMA